MSAYTIGPYFSTFSRMPPTPFVFTSPLDLPNLLAWYDASDAATLFEDESADAAENGDRVLKWTDKSGHGYHLLKSVTGISAGPVYNTTGLNGHPSLYFSLVDFNTALGVTNVDCQNSNVVSAFAVVTLNANCGSAGRIVGIGGNGQAHDYDNNDSSALLYGKDSGGQNIATYTNGGTDINTSVSYDTPMRVGSRLNGSEVEVYVNGVGTGSPGSYSALALGGTSNLAELCVGVPAIDHNTGALYEGFISEIVICTAALTAGQISNLDSYFVTKWGF